MLARLQRQGYCMGVVYRPGEEDCTVAERDLDLMSMFRFKVEIKPGRNEFENEAYQREEVF